MLYSFNLASGAYSTSSSQPTTAFLRASMTTGEQLSQFPSRTYPNVPASSTPFFAQQGPPLQFQTIGPQEPPPQTYHWFYGKEVDGKAAWKAFSIIDSVALEEALATGKYVQHTLVRESAFSGCD